MVSLHRVGVKIFKNAKLRWRDFGPTDISATFNKVDISTIMTQMPPILNIANLTFPN